MNQPEIKLTKSWRQMLKRTLTPNNAAEAMYAPLRINSRNRRKLLRRVTDPAEYKRIFTENDYRMKDIKPWFKDRVLTGATVFWEKTHTNIANLEGSNVFVYNVLFPLNAIDPAQFTNTAKLVEEGLSKNFYLKNIEKGYYALVNSLLYEGELTYEEVYKCEWWPTNVEKKDFGDVEGVQKRKLEEVYEKAEKEVAEARERELAKTVSLLLSKAGPYAVESVNHSDPDLNVPNRLTVSSIKPKPTATVTSDGCKSPEFQMPEIEVSTFNLGQTVLNKADPSTTTESINPIPMETATFCVPPSKKRHLDLIEQSLVFDQNKQTDKTVDDSVEQAVKGLEQYKFIYDKFEPTKQLYFTPDIISFGEGRGKVAKLARDETTLATASILPDNHVSSTTD